MPKNAFSRALVAIVAIVLLAASCGGSSGTSSTGEDASATQSTATSDGADDAGGSDDGASPDDPDQESATDSGTDSGADDAGAEEDEGSGDATQDAIDDALAMLTGDGDFSDEEARWAEQSRAVEQQIQECMRAEGFEYTPEDYSQYASFEDDRGDPDSREWRAENGFGVTGDIESFSNIPSPDDVSANPNRAYYETLSEGEQRAYDRALSGDQVDSMFEGGPDGEDGFSEPTEEEMEAMQEAYENRENIGCAEEAWRAFDENEGNAAFDVLDDAWEDIEARVVADPRVASLLADWSACIAEAGYSYTDPFEMYEDAWSRSNDLYSNQAFQDPFEGLTEDEISALTDDQLEVLQQPSFEIDQEKLAEIKAWEIDLALASYDCGEVAMAGVGEEVYTETVALFLEENRDKIGEALAAGN